MALGATIYKIELHIADTGRHYYGSHTLTVARHPSETTDRLMVRLLAFALHATERLVFTKGISDANEPDIWSTDLTGLIDLWVEVGQPTDTRLMKACSRAQQVVVYCFGGHASEVWWSGMRKKVERVKNLKIVNLPAKAISVLAEDVQRNMVLHVNIQENELFVPVGNNQIAITPTVWREPTG